ncbi:MAG: hypothetical protein FH759_04895 [Sediminimonas qiaohouensis]|uniref:DUF3035 domain-containing protein n=2 Tax=Sediminimonas qiaohouensis TaxID=552061 RepID=A0A7C9LAD2_9RHOB|nr:hypothetical protein [Sediminimonas qiaohouensis]
MRTLACLMFLTVLLPAIPGCTRFPALDDTVAPQDEQAPYPALKPIEPLLDDPQDSAGSDPDTQEEALKARADALRARAARLRAETP